jgi:surface antigen
MNAKYWVYTIIGILLLSFVGMLSSADFSLNAGLSRGQQIDSFNGVSVRYNGSVGNVTGRNTTKNGYNLGLEYQCVEFVKRYYYEHLNHRMPNSYGNAKDFYDVNLVDGQKNKARNLLQYSNPSRLKPQVDDLIIFDGSIFNAYGHVAIISKVKTGTIEIIQQNPGPFGTSRETIPIAYKNGKWKVKNKRVLGWLRKSI